MKVVFVCEGYRPGVDACAKRMESFVDHFKMMGHETVVYASSTNLKEGVADPEVVYCKTTSMSKKSSFQRLLNNVSFPLSTIVESKKVKEADVVVVTSPPLFATLAGIKIADREKSKLVLDTRDVWPEIAFQLGSFTSSSVYGKTFSHIALKAYKRADLVTVVTPGKIDILTERFKDQGINPAKLALVENGLDLGFLKQTCDSSIISKYPSLQENRACVYIGNLGLAQGLEQLLDLAQDAQVDYPDIDFLIFGKGADEGSLRKSKNERGLNNVVFGGTVTPQQAYTILGSACVAFVSLKNNNMTSSVPTKLFEALGVGCPVLLAAEGDAAAILRRTKHGECVTPGNRSAILHGFEKVMSEQNFYESNKACTRGIIASNYSRQSSAIKLEQLVSNLVMTGEKQ